MNIIFKIMLIGKYIFVIFLNLFVIRNFSTCPSIEMLKGYMAGTSPAGGAMVPGPPFEIGAPPFHVWPPGCCIHPILYFKNVAPSSGFWPPAAKSWRRAWYMVRESLGTPVLSLNLGNSDRL